MEPSKEEISVRLARLHAQISGAKLSNCTNKNLSSDSLLDALTVLYDECNSEYLKQNDKNMAKFSDKYKDTMSELKKARVNISDFEVKNVIGRGYFGEVFVVREKQTGDVFAMKSVKKSECLQHSSNGYEEERNIMAYSDSPWLTSLQYAFQDNTNLYFVMEFHPGGDLLGLLDRQGGTLPETAASFYVSELVLALHDLHSMGYVHRDIKPDNILLDRCGHLKLADFGSAARLNDQGVVSDLMPVGTPDYIAPEVLQAMENKNSTYDTSCDYWSVGVLAYEMAVGTTPFSGTSMSVTYSKIMEHKTNLRFPNDITLSQAYINLVKGLIAPANVRLNYRKVIDHPLFRAIDWSGLRDQVPPYVPHVNSVDDTSNFMDVKPKKNQPNIDNFKTKTQFSSRNLPFVGFTYTHNIMQTESCVQRRRNKEILHDERKIEMESLQKRLFKAESSLKETEDLERKLEEKQRKLEGAETVREKLERDLAGSIAEVTSLKRVLDLEKKERSDLERKALELIKSAKTKWETAEKVKTESLNKDIFALTEKCASLITDNKQLREQLDEARCKQEQAHKESLSKVRSLNRQSVVGLENRLEKVTNETQSQVCELQKLLAAETQRCQRLEAELETERRTEADAQRRMAELRQEVEDYRRKLGESLKLHGEQESKIIALEKKWKDFKHSAEVRSSVDEAAVNRKLENAGDQLKREKANGEELKKQINILEQKLKDSRDGGKAQLEASADRYQKEIRKLQDDLRLGSEEREALKTRLEAAKQTDAENKVKIDALEKLLQRLESGVAKLENSGEREQVLQEQVERLEQQVVQIREDTAVERKELSTLKTKLWKMEKDLSNADLDKRIVERELKDSEQQIKQLTLELEKTKQTIESEKDTNAKVVSELAQLNENLSNEVEKLKVVECSLQEQLKFVQASLEEEKARYAELRKELQQKDVSIGSLQNQLLNQQGSGADLTAKLKRVQQENETLTKNLQQHLKRKSETDVELEQLRLQLSNNQLNLNTLRDACSLLEKQLEEYERIQDQMNAKLERSATKIGELTKQLEDSRNETLEAKRSMNEEKSYKLLGETRCKRLEEDVESLRKECAGYKERCKEYKEYSSQLSEELAQAEEKIGDLEVTVNSLERQLAGLGEECLGAKEESSTRLTKVMALKESNAKLNHIQNEIKNENAQLLERILDLEHNLEAAESLRRDRELKFDGIERQQRKLIHYLQSKIEEYGKKKKTLSEKLFGSSKSAVTATPQPYPANGTVKDYETAYREERETNRKLRSELESLLKSSSKASTLPAQATETPVRSVVKHSNSVYVARRIEETPRGNGYAMTATTLSLSKETKEILNGNVPVLHEGWIKVPNSTKTGWESKYAKLSSKWLNVYANSADSIPVYSLNLCPEEGYGRLVTDPSEIGAPLPSNSIAEADLLLQIEINNTCWPPETFPLMCASAEEKEKWTNSLNCVLELTADRPYRGTKILRVTGDLDVNAFCGDPKLLGTEQGLYSWRNEKELLHINGPRKVHQMCVVSSENLVIMIVDANRILVYCDLNVLNSLTLTKQFSNPTIRCETVPAADLNGFHLFRCSDFKERQFVCAATAKQIIILRYNVLDRDFRPLRILDTAEPTSCIHFAQHSLIVGANKFFEIDLMTFQADEFLDVSDDKLSPAICCYKRNSFPIAIVDTASKDRAEFLLCFNEFGIFVDEFGRSCRSARTLQWTKLPVAFAYYAPYLYVVQFAGVEIVRIDPPKEADEDEDEEFDSYRLELDKPRYLGTHKKGVVVCVDDEVILIEGRFVDKDNVSLSSYETNTQQDAFSFTTSMVESLDGHNSDSTADTDVDFRKKVKFTDL